MTEQPWELVEYDRPPVVETVLGVRFREIPRFDAIQIIDFWNHALRDRPDSPSPKASLQPPYQMPVELFGGASGIQAPEIQFSQNLPPPRLWFTSDDDQDLVQIQSDFLGVNWRKQSATGYHDNRYPTRAASFEHYWSMLQEFIREKGLAEKLVPVQCEVMYINHIRKSDEWNDFGDLSTITSLVATTTIEALPSPDGSSLRRSYIILDDAGVPFARLAVLIDSARDTTNNDPLFVMNLTFRGRPSDDSMSAVRRFFDAGHNWIVGVFDAITTPAMHAAWGRQERGE
jgi:uncharacterized protein (TIGR04255 family)